MQAIGKIDVEKYKCVTPDITSDEVIITDERIAHIQERHPGNYEIVRPFLQEAITDPDYILGDKRKNTGLILKRIDKNDLHLQIVLRVHTSNDLEGYKNSILSAWCIGENRWKNYINNKKILYKKE